MRYVAKRFFKGSLSHATTPKTLEGALEWVEHNIRSDADWARPVIHYVVELIDRRGAHDRRSGSNRRIGEERRQA